MSDGVVTLAGQYHDGRRPLGAPVTLRVDGDDALMIGERIEQRYAAPDLRVSPRAGRADRFIALPDGGQLQCADDPLLNRLPQEVPSEGPVAWLEQRQPVALACVALIAAILVIGYVYGLPAVAKRVAARVPIETERALGEQVLSWLDDQQLFRPTQLDPPTQERIRAGFVELSRGLSLQANYRLEFRESTSFGANAMALPGGAIVITDDMVKLAESQDEVMAILAHEVGHQEHRHAMRHLLQTSGAAIVAATVTADAASFGLAVGGLPLLLANARYSREFESEADDFAFERLTQSGISPVAFATIMERVANQRGAEKWGLTSFVSTHPVTAERVQRARDAAAAHERAP